MTYCTGILVRDGLVMIADTRTNAGIDNVSTFRKLHVLVSNQDRTITLASAGNLSITQTVLGLLGEGLPHPESGEKETLDTVSSMFRAAQLVGRAIRVVHEIDAAAMEEASIKFDVSFLLGGQIKGAPMRLFMIYAAGNFIECGSDAPFLQVGEHKYGKPILDRAVTYETHLYDALKVGLISMDSTMRSNLAVGLPIDVLVMRRDAGMPELVHRIEAGEPYFHDLRERWSAALRAAHMAIPRPPYGQPKD
jgi:putative proteasome-type protease